jgi:hypothetical protein
MNDNWIWLVLVVGVIVVVVCCTQFRKKDVPTLVEQAEQHLQEHLKEGFVREVPHEYLERMKPHILAAKRKMTRETFDPALVYDVDRGQVNPPGSKLGVDGPVGQFNTLGETVNTHFLAPFPEDGNTFWPYYYYTNPHRYVYGALTPPGMYSPLYQWDPGYYTNGWTWHIRPDYDDKRRHPQNFWVRNNGDYYFLNQQGILGQPY